MFDTLKEPVVLQKSKVKEPQTPPGPEGDVTALISLESGKPRTTGGGASGPSTIPPSQSDKGDRGLGP